MRRKSMGFKIIVCTLILSLALSSAGCIRISEVVDIVREMVYPEELTEIIIPESFLQFANSDAEATAEGYAEICTEAVLQGGDIILKVTEEEKNEILSMNQLFIDQCLYRFLSSGNSYMYELSEDYTAVTYRYDENISMFMEAQILLGVTATYVLNGIINGNPTDWSVKVTIENCHTGKIVASGTLPEDTITYGADEWAQSYEE